MAQIRGQKLRQELKRPPPLRALSHESSALSPIIKRPQGKVGPKASAMAHKWVPLNVSYSLVYFILPFCEEMTKQSGR